MCGIASWHHTHCCHEKSCDYLLTRTPEDTKPNSTCQKATIAISQTNRSAIGTFVPMNDARFMVATNLCAHYGRWNIRLSHWPYILLRTGTGRAMKTIEAPPTMIMRVAISWGFLSRSESHKHARIPIWNP
jgi:hypothetical protein